MFFGAKLFEFIPHFSAASLLKNGEGCFFEGLCPSKKCPPFPLLPLPKATAKEISCFIHQPFITKTTMSPLSNQLQFQFKNDFLWLLIAFCMLIFVPSFIPSGFAKTTTIYATLLLAIFFSILSTAINKKHLYWSTIIAILAVLSNLLPSSSENVFVFLLRMVSCLATRIQEFRPR